MEEASGSLNQTWDISPELDASQHQAIFNILMEYSDVFAVEPKRSKGTHMSEHVIESGNSRPIKANYNKVDPWTEQEIERQVDQMLTNGIIQK